MNYIIEYWYLGVLVFALGIIAEHYFSVFFKKPTPEKINDIKNWLIYACIKSEKEFKAKTGVIKLRDVYDAFLTKYPAVAQIVSFETFSKWVDLALIEAKKIMENNPEIQNYISK